MTDFVRMKIDELENFREETQQEIQRLNAQFIEAGKAKDAKIQIERIDGKEKVLKDEKEAVQAQVVKMQPLHLRLLSRVREVLNG